MENNKAKIKDIISAMAERLEHNEKNICRVDLDELSNDEIEALLNVKHDRFEFNIEYGLYIEMTEKEAWTAFEKAAAENGTIEYEGEEYALLQDAYLDDTCEIPHYAAIVTNKKGDTYQIRWEFDSGYNAECDNEEDYDWYKPTKVRLIDIAD